MYLRCRLEKYSLLTVSYNTVPEDSIPQYLNPPKGDGPTLSLEAGLNKHCIVKNIF